MSPANSTSINIGTYNILNPFHAVKWQTAEGLNEQQGDNWDEWRRDAILDNLRQAPLDICALQEVSARTHPELARAVLGGHSAQITQLYTHFTKEEAGAHGVCVLYREERFELISDRALRTPQDDHRCATYVELRDRESGLHYRVISAHLKGYNPYEETVEVKRGEQTRGDQEQLSYLAQLDAATALEEAETSTSGGVFFLGDFNEDAAEMQARGASSRQGQLASRGFIWSGVHAPTETRSGRQIDWVFYQSGHEQRQARLTPLAHPQNLAASDHALTSVRLEVS